MKIIICHDGSEGAQRAMEKAIEIFKPMQPEVIILTVIEIPLDATSHAEEAFAEWRTERQKVLDKAADWVVMHGLEVDAILAEGDPRIMIMDAIKAKSPDVVIIGKRGGGVLKEIVLGSVSAYLTRHATCPVLVIH